MTTPLECALLLHRMPDIGPARYRRLIESFGGAERALAATEEELSALPGFGPHIAQAMLRYSPDRDGAKKELDLAGQNGIRILSLEDPLYPERLRQIPDAPPILYVRGKLELLEAPAIALVGTRAATFYGERMARTLSADLARCGIATVSGLARGIDTFVHQATLAAGGATLAVLGTGILNVYPAQNKKLAEEISQKGLLLSEYPLLSGAAPGNFPERNRIISGISLGTVVIEAGETSGALITGRYAAEQGREVFAVPGPATSRVSRGANRLIKNGAKLTERAEDILEEIPLLHERLGSLTHYYKEGETKPNISLSREETDVLTALSAEPLHIDRLSARFKISSGAFSKVLLDLELKGMIKALPGNIYARI